MTSNGNTTFKEGNKSGTGRKYGSQNSTLLEMHRLGEERVMSHYAMLSDLAEKGDKDAAMFLVNKVLPNAKGCRMIKIELPSMENIDKVGEAQDHILKNVGEGLISIEEGEKLFAMAEQRRKVIENKEIIERWNELDSRLTQAGL